MNYRFPSYFISHGGGPWPWLADMRTQFDVLERSLQQMVAQWPQTPKAILMVSGHWEEAQVGIMAGQKPPMIYDYFGFPKETYEIVYPAPGAPELAQKIYRLLAAQGINAFLDDKRGFDHGTFAPLQIMYPAADVPVVQVSILQSYRPQDHFKIGQALAELREQGVVIIGSGLSFHNLRQLGPSAKLPSAAFDQWLHQTLMASPKEREEALCHWTEAPYARFCHPEEDHLVPLFVALGAAYHGQAQRVYHEAGFMGGVTVSSYRFD